MLSVSVGTINTHLMTTKKQVVLKVATAPTPVLTDKTGCYVDVMEGKYAETGRTYKVN